jgi:hypothetical protein
MKEIDVVYWGKRCLGQAVPLYNGSCLGIYADAGMTITGRKYDTGLPDMFVDQHGREWQKDENYWKVEESETFGWYRVEYRWIHKMLK